MALDELHAASKCVKPEAAGQPGLGKRNQFGTVGDRFFDQLDGLRHPRIETDELATLQLPRVMAQDGCVALLSPVDFALCDSTRPNELRLHALFQHYVFRLADPTLRTAMRDTQSVTASTVCGQHGQHGQRGQHYSAVARVAQHPAPRVDG